MQMARRQLAQALGKGFDHVALTRGHFPLGQGGGAEDFDGAGDGADFILTVMGLTPDVQIAGGHARHHMRRLGHGVQDMVLLPTQRGKDQPQIVSPKGPAPMSPSTRWWCWTR
jgi:hypothetical protein